MRRILFVAVLALLVPAFTAQAAPAEGGHSDRLDVYSAVVAQGQLHRLAEQGHDVSAQRPVDHGLQVDLVLTTQQRDQLRKQGFELEPKRARDGRTVRELASAQAAGGFEVWRSWDEDGGLRDQMRDLARSNPQIAKLVRIGTTVQGREILALKLTQGARDQVDGSRPAVLYSSAQHAREWISPEVNRRLLRWFVDRWRANDRKIKNLLKEHELWFVLVANPDGYEHTFDSERLWRKNLRDNNGDGQITTGDGVDLNRNFPSHWGYDEEGSSSIPSSETYRGTAPVSEPETVALKGLLDRIGFAFQVNWHSAGEGLLYAQGWQVATPTADDPIYYALSGNLDEPSIDGYHPGLSSDVLYVTNGETTDYAHTATGALAWTPELAEGCEGCGFVFPDDEELVEAEFQRNLPFALSVARSAGDPDDPQSAIGIATKPFYLESDDPYKDGLPGLNLTFDVSYGDPQPVQVLAKRSLGEVTVKYQVNGGPVQTAPTSEWQGGSGSAPGVHYRQLRGVVTGTDPGDSVEVWFEGGGETSGSFTYEAVSDTGNRVLVVAAEDYTGASPAQPSGPHHLGRYLDALGANGLAADVYDIDARGRVAPDHLGVLAHYDAVVWYTGDDIVTRRLGWGPGNADRLAMDEILEFREYLDEGGKVLYTGDWAGEQYTANVGTQRYDPKGESSCSPLPAGQDPRRCLALHGSGDGVNDVLQYFFGGYLAVLGDGIDGDGSAFDLTGIDTPFAGLSWGLNGADSAGNQDATSSFIATSGILPEDRFPQFESWPSARWDKPGGPFDPHSGQFYVYSQLADVSYKRMTREIAVPVAGDRTLEFWTSYDTESHWDHVFVEARTAGGNDWTTLPDLNGSTDTDTGDSCAFGWRDLHPHLDHYQTYDAATGACTPTGTTGAWHAASGASSGWQEWEVDLSAWAGRTVEVSIAYASDWALQNLGVFVDDVTLPDGSSTSFEADLGGWTVTGPPDGSGPNANDWDRTDASGFPVGAAISTPRSLLMGFGLEGISTQAERDAVMGRAMAHLLD